MTGTIFDIKEFSIHDGPGARTTVFLKGCPMRCKWCHNPEGLLSTPQLMVKKQLCTGCGHCFAARLTCSHPECAPHERCVHACPNGCLAITGEMTTAETLAKKLLKQAPFFRMTGGGITISGGEPLLQSDFVIELTKHLGDVHKAIQTSGYAPPDVYRQVIGCFDYVMQDIKLVNEALHLQYTGVSNRNILENIDFLKSSGKEFVFRVPLIPGITDTPDNLQAIAKLTQDAPVEYLPYNHLAGAKYEMLDMIYPLQYSADHTT